MQPNASVNGVCVACDRGLFSFSLRQEAKPKSVAAAPHDNATRSRKRKADVAIVSYWLLVVCCCSFGFVFCRVTGLA